MKFYTIILIQLIVATTLTTPGKAQGLHIGPGANIVISGAPSLVLNNTGLINDGLFLADNSTVLFTGDAPASAAFIGGGLPVTFYHLTIRKSSGDVALNNNAAVTGNMTLDSGNLQLNDNVLDLGTSGLIVGERNNACITSTNGGIIKATALLNAPQAVNPGNIGVGLSSTVDLGWTVIYRGHAQQEISGGQSGILRYFDIVPAVRSNVPVTLRFYYLDGELVGKDKNALSIFSSTADHTGWSLWGRTSSDDQSDIGDNWVAKTNTGQLHRFTLAIPGSSNTDAAAKASTRSYVRIAPNPSAGLFRMIIVSGRETDRIVRLYDPVGRLLQIRVVHCLAGSNSIEWQVTGYAQGLYYLIAEGLEITPVEIIK